MTVPEQSSGTEQDDIMFLARKERYLLSNNGNAGNEQTGEVGKKNGQTHIVRVRRIRRTIGSC